ncbi:MAG: hypothetical protein ACREPM_18325 [Gemmatimonadaceae bacterium]
MTVSGVGSVLSTSPLYPVSSSDATSPSDPTDGQSLRRPQRTQFQSDFASLLSAVKSGDMSAAQQALSAVQNDQSTSSATYSSQATQGKGPLSSDIQSLFQAVQSGNSSAAQQALTQLQTDAQQQAQTRGAGGHGHHHHHHQASSTDTSSDTSTNTSSVTNPTSTNDASAFFSTPTE